MGRLHALVAVLLLPTAQPVLVGTGIAAAALLVFQPPAGAQSAEAVAKIAQTITVRIEGATQGSGVLVKRNGKRYTVLTAWHVVKGQRSGEELDIYTSDGQSHPLEQGTIKHLGEVDLAVLSFTSPTNYRLAEVGDVKSVAMGSPLFVGGFPLASSAVPLRLLRFLKGEVIANATVAIPNGYQLLYSNPTLPGMSGGAVMNAKGQLIGIHANAERADQISESSGKAVATGTNQAVPIAYYSQYSRGQAVVASSSHATTADDYLAQARALLHKKGNEQEVIRLADKSLETRLSAEAYTIRGIGKANLSDNQGAIADYNQAIAINPQYASAYVNRGIVKYNVGDKQGAIAEYNQAVAINPQRADIYVFLGIAKSDLGDKQGAITEYSKAIAVYPQDYAAYRDRGLARSDLGDKQGAIADFTQAIAINPQFADAFISRGNRKAELGDKQGAILDYSQAIAINPKSVDAYFNRGIAKSDLGDKQGTLADYGLAIAINPQFALAYINRGIEYERAGNIGNACKDWRVAAELGKIEAALWVSRQC